MTILGPRLAGRLVLLAQAAGLLATGWLVWRTSVAPYLGVLTLTGILVEALFYVLLAWGFSAVLTLAIRSLTWSVGEDVTARSSFSTAAAGIWFAPALILLASLSPVWIFVSFAILMNTTRLLVAEWVPLGSRLRDPRFGWALVIAFAMQAGVVAALWNRPLSAAALIAAGVAMVTALAVVTGAYAAQSRAATPPWSMGGLLTFFLAVMMSAGGIEIGIPLSHSSGLFPFTRTILRRAFDTQPLKVRVRPEYSVTELYEPTGTKGVVGSGGFPGVVLRPERKKESRLVVPTPSPEGLYGTSLKEPVSIPFDGEYWLFQPPLSQPPLRGSLVERGTPFELSFRVNNPIRLVMEARQQLRQTVDLACCSAIQLDAVYRDPGVSVTVQLSVRDSQARGLQTQNFGSAAAGTVSRETLSYSVPSAPLIGKFDEIRVAFRQAGMYRDRSPHIAIERTVLIPKSGRGQ